MKLEDILASLEKSAEDKSEKTEDKKDDKNPMFVKKDEKDTKKEEAKEEEQEKSAAFKAGADLAKEVMEKVASKKAEQTNKGEEMNKQASEAGKALAQALLKKAGVGDQSTDNGIPAGVVPNKTQVDLAQQKAEHDAVFQPTPGTDGAGSGGTVNQIFDAIVADAFARTGAKDGHQSTGYSAAEGAANAQAPAQVQVATGPGAIGFSGENQEKAAAVSALVEAGHDFEAAVSLVKAASDELDFEHDQQVKQAALNELLGSGVSFEKAVAMVKSASAGANVEIEKKAALDALMGEGVDFDTAVDLVNSKAQELYGK